jgi:hypothetical protein
VRGLMCVSSSLVWKSSFTTNGLQRTRGRERNTNEQKNCTITSDDVMSRSQNSGEPKVTQLDVVILIEQHVGRLDVTMQHRRSHLVHVGESLGRFHSPAKASGQRVLAYLLGKHIFHGALAKLGH